MGSPENYYGIFGLTRGLTSTSTTIQIVHSSSTADTGWKVATAAPGTAGWTASNAPSGTLVNSVNVNDTIYAQTPTTNTVQQWGTFGVSPSLAANQTLTSIDGIEVRLSDAYVPASGCASSRIQVALSWNNGTNYSTTTTQTGTLPTSTTSGDFTLGSSSSLSAWGAAQPLGLSRSEQHELPGPD